MKTAILISGHMRTFARCFDNLRWFVFNKFPEADFFVSTVADLDVGSAELLREKFPKAQVEIDVVPNQPELPIPVAPFVADWTVGRMYGHEPYSISVHPQAILRQLWQLDRCWEFFASKVYEGQATRPADGSVEGYDVIIRLRPDLWFRSFDSSALHKEVELAGDCGPGISKMNVPPPPQWAKILTVGTRDALTPWWGRFGGVNDRFAVLGPKAAQAYFTTFSRIPELLAAGCPLHPESLVKASMEAAGCHIDDTMRAEFSKLYGPENPKLNGTFRDPEITAIDIAHLGGKSK